MLGLKISSLLCFCLMHVKTEFTIYINIQCQITYGNNNIKVALSLSCRSKMETK